MKMQLEQVMVGVEVIICKGDNHVWLDGSGE